MPININRPIITYENIALLQSSTPAYGAESNSGNNISFLPLVQGVDFSFDIQRTDVAALGTKGFVNQSIKNAPDVNLTVNAIENFGDLFSSMFSEGGVKDNLDLDRNFYAVIGDQRGVDFSGINLSGKTVIGFGNCFLDSISMSQSVNGIINSAYSFMGSNIQAQELVQNNNIFSGHSPAINLTGNQLQSGTVQFSEMSDYYSNSINDIVPYYSTNVLISGNSSVGNFLIESDCIQDFSLDLPINRKTIYGIGKKYPIIRKATYPNKGSFKFSNKVSTFEVSGVRANLKNFLNLDESYNLIISGQNYEKTDFSIEISGATFKSQNISSSVGQELSSDLSFDFDINKIRTVLA
jgi:hypothetical protein